MNAVSKEDVARLNVHLVVPIGVEEALMRAEPLEGETQYALHVALSEIDPDSALLAIALSAYRIAQNFPKNAVAAAVKLESNRIIGEYGPDWLAHYSSKPPTGKDLYELLTHVPEDLDSMADLLESLQVSISDENNPAHALCAVLSIQARAHMEIADYVLSELEKDGTGDCFADCLTAFDYTPEQVYTDNIILFPLHRRH